MTAVVPMATAGRKRVRNRRKMRTSGVVFVLVCLGIPFALFALFVIWPFIQAITYSLTDWGGFSQDFNFVGLDNYKTLFTDPIFLKALRNSAELALVVPLVTIILSLTLASVITVGGSSTGAVRGLARSSFYRIVSFFPYTIPAIVIGLVWAQNLDPSNGLLNAFLTGIGLHHFESFPWLGNNHTAMPISMFVIVWGFVGFYMVLFIASIKGIPAELYDAARVDGAGRFRMTFTVTLPMIRDSVQTAYIYLGITALDAFVYMSALNSGGGPNNSTLTMSQDLYKTAFSQSQFGLSSAMGVMLAVVTLVFAGLVFTVNRLTRGRDA